MTEAMRKIVVASSPVCVYISIYIFSWVRVDDDDVDDNSNNTRGSIPSSVCSVETERRERETYMLQSRPSPFFLKCLYFTLLAMFYVRVDGYTTTTSCMFATLLATSQLCSFVYVQFPKSQA